MLHILIVLITLVLPFPGFSQTELDPVDRKALKEVERQVNELKEQVYRSKVRLRELEEAVLRGKITGSKALINFENRAEGFFTFASAEFYLDDQLIYRTEGKGRKTSIKNLKVFDRDLPSGQHVLAAKIMYQGSGKSVYAPFAYFKDHKFELKIKETFEVEYGKTTFVKLTALDKGYFKGEVKDRLQLKTQVLKDWGSDS